MSSCTSRKLCGNDKCEICFNKSFASSNKANYWSNKNKKNPREVFKSSGNKYLFNCNKCSHEFYSALSYITNGGTWCPYCSNKKLCNDDCEICFNKSFVSSDKAKYWSSKNKKKPREVFKSSHKKYLFNCDKCSHEFYSALNDITNRGNWCPYCACYNGKLCNDDTCEMCSNNSFASSDKAEYWSKKNKKNSREVSKSSGTKYLFNCDKCFHEFNTTLGNITNSDRWCPYCANKKLCNDDCEICFNKSFASSNKADYWSSKNKKKSREIFKSSGIKYLFNCDKCFHEFDSVLDSITRGTWCPYCSNQKLCDNDTCNMCLNNSFASSNKAKYWSKKNKKNSREVSKSSNDKYFFNCNKCSHEFNSALNNISNGRNWCPYCANHKLCDNDICEMSLNNSFASSNKAKYWSSKNKEKPREVFKSSHRKYLFNCDKCFHEFDSALNNITNGGNWCPNCVNKTEKMLLDFFKEHFNNLEIEKEKKFDWCKNERCLPFDFYIEELSIIIELDGEQHFSKISNWKPPEERQIIDKFKMDNALSNGIAVIRILQEDVYYDRNDWKNKIIFALNQKYSEPECVFIFNDKFDVYIDYSKKQSKIISSENDIIKVPILRKIKIN